MLPTNQEARLLLAPVPLEQKILKITLVKDPFAQAVAPLRENPAIPASLFEALKPPEVLCTQGLKEPIRAYQDITLDPGHPLFNKIHAVVDNILQCHLNKTAADKLLTLYRNYIQSVCAASSKERIRLLKGDPRLHMENQTYLFLHKTARHITSCDSYGETASAVSYLGGIHYKRARPNSLGMEYAVDSLNTILSGRGSSPSQLLKIEGVWIKAPFHPANQGHPSRKILAQAIAEGTPLDQYFKEHPAFKNAYPFQETRIGHIIQAAYPIPGINLGENLDPFNFSALCLLALCTAPNNGQASNSNAFAPRDGNPLLNFLLLPQMNEPIDPAFRARLKASAPELLFLEWLHALHLKNQHYASNSALTLEDLENLQLPIRLTFAFFQHSYQTFVKAKACIGNIRTHRDLSEHLILEIAASHRKHLKEEASISKAHERLFEHPLWAETGFPEYHKIKEDPETLLIRWVPTLHFSDQTSQERFLENLFHDFPQLERLSFHCLLDDAVFVRILSKGQLKELTLITFPNLTPAGIRALLHRHPLHLIMQSPGFSQKECAAMIQLAWENHHLLSVQWKDKTLPLQKGQIDALLLHALQEDNPYWAEASLLLGAQPGQPHESGTLLHHFASRSSEALNFLLQKGASPNTKNKAGQTPLHIAAAAQNRDAIQTLLKAGASLDAQDLDGKTPLHLAVLSGSQETAIELLHQGANPMALTKENQSPFHLAASAGHLEIAKNLFTAAKNRKEALNQSDSDGKTPLHHAVWGDPKPELVQFLLENGANVHARNNFGYTPLHWAAKHGHLDSFKSLIEEGSDLFAVNANGDAAMDLALRWGQNNIISHLIDPEKECEESRSESDPNDPEGFYYLKFESSFENNRPADMVFYLEKMGGLALQKGNYLKAAHLLNAALATAETHTLNSLYQKSLFNRLEHLEGLLLEKLFGAKTPAEHRGYIKKNRKQLQKLRQEVRKKLDADEPAEAIQNFFSERCSQLLTAWIREAIHLAKAPPPTSFAVIALGSLARKELCPYSDVEFAILMEKSTPETLAYFRNLSQLLELRITNLGETKWEIIRPKRGLREAESLTPSGFSMDIGGLSPRGKEGVYELIGTPQQLAGYQDPKWLQKNEGELILANAMTQVSLLMGEFFLLSQYQASVDKWLRKRTLLGNFDREGKRRAHLLLKGHLEEFKPWLTEERAELRAFDIKKDFYRPLQMAVGGLLLFYGLKAHNTLLGIEVLKRKGICNIESAGYLKRIMQKILSLRLKAHLFYHEEKEILFQKHHREEKNRGLFLLEEDSLIPIEIYRVLVPFHKAMHLFLKKEKRLADAIFFDPEIGVISTQDEDELRYEQAYFTCIQNLALNPNNPENLYYLGSMSFELGEIKKALKYNRERLRVLKSRYGDMPHPETGKTLSELGIVYAHLGEAQQALNCCNEAIELINHVHTDKPHHQIAEAYQYLGNVYLYLDDYIQSKLYYEKALEIYKQIPDSKCCLNDFIKNLAIVYINLGETQNAVFYFEHCLTHHKENHGNQPTSYKAQVLTNLGNAYRDIGKINLAISCYEESLNIYSQVYKKKPHTQTALTLSNLGNTFERLRDYKKAIQHFKQALEIRKQLSDHDSNFELANAYVDLGEAYRQFGKYKESCTCFEQAMEAIEKKKYEKFLLPRLASVLYRLGRSFTRLEDFKEAFSHAEQALELYKEIHKTEPHSKVADTLITLGTICENREDYEEALLYFEQALSIQKQLKENCLYPKIANTWEMLGTIYRKLRKEGKAHFYYTQALEAHQQEYAGRPSNAAIVLENLGDIYTHLKNNEEALSCYLQALDLHKVEHSKGPHPDIIRSLDNLAHAYIHLKNYRQAILCLEQCAEMERELYNGNPHPFVASTFINLGATHEKNRELEQAIVLFEQALEMQKQIYEGGAHLDLALTLMKLGDAKRKLKEFKQAIVYFEQSLVLKLQIYENKPHPSVARSYDALGNASRKMGDSDQAVLYFNHALETFKQIYGEKPHPDIAVVLNNLGTAYRNLGLTHQAIDAYEQSLAIQKRIDGNICAIAITLNNLGDAFYDLGEMSRCISYFQLALEKEREISENKDSNEPAILTKLGDAYSKLGDIEQAIFHYHQVIKLQQDEQPDRAAFFLLMRLGDAYDKLGNPEQALEYYKKALSIQKVIQSEGEDSTAVSLLGKLGNMSGKLGEMEQAIFYYKQALAALEESRGAPDSDKISFLNVIGRCYAKLGNADLAILYLERSISEIDRMEDSNYHSDRMAAFYQLSSVYESLGNYQQMIGCLEEALKNGMQVHDNQPHSEIAGILVSLGMAYSKAGEIVPAIAAYEQAIAMWQAVYHGEAHSSNVALFFNVLARLYEDSGDIKKAVFNYESALTIYKKLYGETPHPEMAATLARLGSAHASLGDEEQFTLCYENALSMYRLLEGDAPSIKIARTLNNMGNAYKDLEKMEQAAFCYEQALEIKKMICKGSPSIDVARGLYNLGKIHQELGRTEKAIDSYEESLSICEQMPEGSSAEKNKILNSLGLLYKELGNESQAIVFFEEALKSLNTLPGGTPIREHAETLFHLSEAYKAAGDEKRTIEYLEQILDIYKKVHQNKPHSDVAVAFMWLGLGYMGFGKVKEAIPCYKQALHLYEKMDEEHDVNAVLTLNNLGSAYGALGEEKQALRYFEQALCICENNPGLNEKVPMILVNLGNSYRELNDESQAIIYFGRALSAARQLHNDKPHLDIVEILIKIGAFYAGLEDENHAAGYYVQALAMQRELYKNKPHPKLVATLSKLANLSAGICDMKKAAVYHKEALPLLREMYEDKAHRDTVATLERLGDAYSVLGQAAEAICCYEEALQMDKDLYGDQLPPQVAALLLCKTGYAHRKLNETHQAIVYYEQALDLYRLAYGSNPCLDMAITFENLGLAYCDLTRVSHQHSDQFGQTVLSDAEENPEGRVNLTLPRDALKADDETDGQSDRMVGEKSGLGKAGVLSHACAYLMQALSIYKQVYSSAHSRIAHSLSLLGFLSLDLKDAEQAVLYLEQALAVYNQINDDKPQQDVGNVLDNLGDAYKRLGNMKAAASSYEQALQIFLLIMGPENPRLKEMQDKLNELPLEELEQV